MARLVQTRWNGQFHHAIEYGKPRRAELRERFGVQTASLIITNADADRGIYALVRENFPEIAEEPAFYGS